MSKIVIKIGPDRNLAGYQRVVGKWWMKGEPRYMVSINLPHVTEMVVKQILRRFNEETKNR